MRRLTVTQQQFTDMISSLIQSGVTFDASTIDDKENSYILITFTGGY